MINLMLLMGELKERINKAKEKASQAITDLKNIAYGLKPEMLYNLGLIPSLRALFDDMKKNAISRYRFLRWIFLKRWIRRKNWRSIALLRSHSTNIVKHSRAKNVFVNLVKKK